MILRHRFHRLARSLAAAVAATPAAIGAGGALIVLVSAGGLAYTARRSIGVVR